MSRVEFHVSDNPHLPAARQLMGFATHWTPENIYRESGQPVYDLLPEQVTDFVVQKYQERHETTSRAIQLLIFGLGDATTFVKAFLQHHPGFNKRETIEKLVHHDTIDSMALTANRPNDDVTKIFGDWDLHYQLNPDHTGVTATHRVEGTPVEHCPVVHYGTEGIRAEPVFRRFHKWSAELAVISYFDYMD